jgi:glycine cleavage system H protein
VNDIPDDLQYTRSHEWIRRSPNGEVEIGVTDHAQGALGDMVFVEVPEVGRSVTAGAACAVIESVKAASDIYSPVSGTVVATNPELAKHPELVNRQPYAAGWLLRVAVDPSAAGEPLLSAAEYAQYLTTQAA